MASSISRNWAIKDAAAAGDGKISERESGSRISQVAVKLADVRVDESTFSKGST